jgi:ectoine hydroxylase-related dioxygenase (phytanoyl-CoA dioxygenase family)
MTDAQAERFPAHVHRLSPVLTLQGAVAHCDMPLETGPTRYLPHSQKYESGYLAWRRPEFKDYFAEHHVQIPLTKGDAVFFNPALFHAAGTNVTADVRRMANLLQISSAFGRAMEDVNRREMSRRLLPVLIERHRAGAPIDEIRRVIASSTEGYAFPGDLDVDQPLDGLAPESDAVIMERAVVEGWTVEALNSRFAASGQR